MCRTAPCTRWGADTRGACPSVNPSSTAHVLASLSPPVCEVELASVCTSQVCSEGGVSCQREDSEPRQRGRPRTCLLLFCPLASFAFPLKRSQGSPRSQRSPPAAGGSTAPPPARPPLTALRLCFPSRELEALSYVSSGVLATRKRVRFATQEEVHFGRNFIILLTA